LRQGSEIAGVFFPVAFFLKTRHGKHAGKKFTALWLLRQRPWVCKQRIVNDLIIRQ
jgi:hypothetical protein